MNYPRNLLTQNDIASNAIKGAIAGAIGVWAMDRLDWFLFEHEDAQARHRTEAVRPDGLDPAHVAAGKAARMLGTELHPAQPNAAGIATHYALGIGPGAIYGALRERLPASDEGQDVLYGLGLGLALFLVQDEGLNQVMGLSGKQRDYPWQAHARGLAAHLALGLVTNTVLNLLGAPRPGPREEQRSHHSLQPESRPMAVPPVAYVPDTRTAAY